MDWNGQNIKRTVVDNEASKTNDLDQTITVSIDYTNIEFGFIKIPFRKLCCFVSVIYIQGILYWCPCFGILYKHFLLTNFCFKSRENILGFLDRRRLITLSQESEVSWAFWAVIPSKSKLLLFFKGTGTFHTMHYNLSSRAHQDTSTYSVLQVSLTKSFHVLCLPPSSFIIFVALGDFLLVSVFLYFKIDTPTP